MCSDLVDDIFQKHDGGSLLTASHLPWFLRNDKMCEGEFWQWGRIM